MRVKIFYPLTVFIYKPSKKPNYGHAGRPGYDKKIVYKILLYFRLINDIQKK
jgi:hypothetical protein